MILRGFSPAGVPALSYVGSPDGFVVGGLPGRAATVAVGSTTTGAAGSSASVVNAGSSNAAVLNFTIPTGAQGPQGNAGAPGSATINGVDATTLGRLVGTLGSTGNATNRWTKVLSFTAGTPYQSAQLLIWVGVDALQNNNSALLSVGTGNNAPGQLPTLTLNVIASSGNGSHIAADSFKLVSNGEGQPTSLWLKSVGPYASYRVFELARSTSGGAMSVTYDQSASWTATEPTGTAVNVSSAGVTAFGKPVVTTTGAQSLTNKTLTNPSLYPGAGGFKTTLTATADGADANLAFRVKGDGNLSVESATGGMAFQVYPGAGTANYVRVDSSAANSPLSIRAIGTDTDISINLLPKGAGVVQAGGNPVVNKNAAVPATATSTGIVGQVAYDSTWFYVCTATNTWRRAALSTW
jgi:hypothetical protein